MAASLLPLAPRIHRPVHYIAIDTQPNGKARMYDSRTEQSNTIDFEGVRTFLQKYINSFKLDVISIHESHLPQKTQLVCWYRF